MKYLVLLALLVPFASGLEIIAPQATVTAQTLPTSVLASWTGDQAPYAVSLTNDGLVVVNTSTNDTNYSFDLAAGNYALHVSSNESNATHLFSVVQNTSEENTSEPITIAIETSKSTYELGETVQFTVSADTQITANLTIFKDGQSIEVYTLNIASTLTFVYIPEESGSYTAVMSSQGQQAETNFSVEKKEPLAVDFSYTILEVNKGSSFNAQVTGGDPPYDYRWIFSDDTTSTGKDVTHYFFTGGSHGATLVVTDASNARVSTDKTFVVPEKRFRLEVTVQNPLGENLENIKVELSDSDGNDVSRTTDPTGTVFFPDVLGSYTIELKRLSTVYVTEDINVTNDTNLLYTITTVAVDTTPVDTTPTDTNTSNQTIQDSTPENASENTSNTTSTLPEPAQEEQPAVSAQSNPVEEVAQLSEPDPVEEARLRLEDKRQESLSILDERLFSLKLSSKKDEVLRLLGIDKTFDQVKNGVSVAENEQRIDELLQEVPLDINIIEERTKVTYPQEEDIATYLEEFFTVKGITDKKLKKSYEYSIEQLSKNVSIKETVIGAEVKKEGDSQRYTIVKKLVTGPSDIHFVEFIPKSFAQDVSDLRITGSFEILESDPVLLFRNPEYTYVKEGEQYDIGYTLAVPNELSEPNLLTGLLSVEIGDTNPTRNWIYILVVLLVSGILGANVLVKRKRRSAGLFTDFTTLTNQALDMMNQGEKSRAADLTIDIVEIFNQLPGEQQKEIHEIILHLDANKREQDFVLHMQDAYSSINQHADDVNVISKVYEDVISHYESLPEGIKEIVQPHIEQLDTFLDERIEM